MRTRGSLLILSLLLVSVLAAPLAHADHNPNRWLLEGVVDGDGVVRGNAVTVDEVVIEETTGFVTVTACCGLEDLATCPSTRTYQIGWELGAPYEELGRGDEITVALSNELVSGADCPDIDPVVVVGEDSGNPADGLDELGITIEGPNDLLTGGGGRFYTDPTNADHDASVRTVVVQDIDNMPHDGYFHIDISQRWGLQYEVTWIYRYDDGPPADDVALCACATPRSGPPAAAAAAVALLFALLRMSPRPSRGATSPRRRAARSR